MKNNILRIHISYLVNFKVSQKKNAPMFQLIPKTSNIFSVALLIIFWNTSSSLQPWDVYSVSQMKMTWKNLLISAMMVCLPGRHQDAHSGDIHSEFVSLWRLIVTNFITEGQEVRQCQKGWENLSDTNLGPVYSR